jgi:hypothetical protein
MPIPVTFKLLIIRTLYRYYFACSGLPVRTKRHAIHSTKNLCCELC